ncbi:MAG: PAS domain S-box protein [Planctomycetes bacterium]|nr:PAS domain S-box protein [Planctomycetota bacterium]
MSALEREIERELRCANRALRTIAGANQALVRATERRAFLDDVCRIVVETGGYRMAWIGFADAGPEKRIIPAASAGFGDDYLTRVRITWDDSESGRGPGGTAIRTGRPSVARNIETDPQFEPWREQARLRGYGSNLAVPFRTTSGEFGNLSVYAVEPDAFDDREFAVIGELASDVAFGLDTLETRAARERAEREYTRRAAYFRALTEHALDIVSVFAADGAFSYMSPSIESVLGWQVDEMIGRRVLDFVHADDREFISAAIGRAIATPGTPVALEFRFHHRDGTWRVLEGIGKWVVTDAIPGAVIANSRDVTERRKLEDQLRQAQRMDAVGRLAGGVAHDFNNLLTVIQGYTTLVEAGLAPDDPNRERAAQVLRASERAQRLTQQLLAFSRKQITRPTVLDLRTVVAESTKLLRQLIGEDIDVITLAPPSLGRVKADAGQIDQVIMNLAVNARDAMPDGGKLTIAMSDEVLGAAYVATHAGAREGRFVALTVADTGHGMTPDVVSHAFEPFFTTKGPGKGTGLGLATVYGIVKQSDGYVEVTSEPGRGSCFRVFFPRVDDELAPVLPAPQIPHVGSTGETVLVAEDEEPLRRLIVSVLTSAGFAVITGATPDAVLALATSHDGPIAILVTDVVMPQLTGPQLAARIRGIRPGIRVLYISGYTSDAIGRLGALDEGVALLRKPFRPGGLIAKVREVLDAAPA